MFYNEGNHFSFILIFIIFSPIFISNCKQLSLAARMFHVSGVNIVEHLFRNLRVHVRHLDHLPLRLRSVVLEHGPEHWGPNRNTKSLFDSTYSLFHFFTWLSKYLCDKAVPLFLGHIKV